MGSISTCFSTRNTCLCVCVCGGGSTYAKIYLYFVVVVVVTMSCRTFMSISRPKLRRVREFRVVGPAGGRGFVHCH